MLNLSFGIPVLSFPDRDHAGQQNNTSVIAENRLGYCLYYFISPDEIPLYIKEIVYNGKFVENAESMRQLSEQMNGANALCKLLEVGVIPNKKGWGKRLWNFKLLRIKK